MQSFFHPRTKNYTSAYLKASAAVGIVLMLPCILCLIWIIFDFRSLADTRLNVIRLTVIGACIAVWLILSYIFYAAATMKIKRVSRYTYFEIQQSHMVFSQYGGSWKLFGRRTVVRELYIIPFEGTRFTVKNGQLKFSGNIRKYEGDSERMGYHIRRGEIEFDNWWYNDNGYKELKSFTLPDIFGKPSFIFRCCRTAQSRSARIAEKRRLARMHRLSPVSKIPPKPRKRVYSEIPTYNRKW